MNGLAALCLMICAAGAAPFSRLQARLDVLLHDQPGLVSVVCKDLQTGAQLSINDTLVLHAASTMKIAVLIEVYRQADQGRFHMSDSLVVTNRFRSIVDGSTFSLPQPDSSADPVFRRLGRKMTWRQLAYNMITWSSNLATNILIDQVGAQNIQRTVVDLGATRMQVRRGVEDSLAFAQGLNNETCSRDLLALLQALDDHRAASDTACEDMIAILLDQHIRDKIPSLLPKNVAIAHKTGSITAINHDAALVFLPDGRRYILVVMTKGFADQQQSNALIARISRLVYDAFIKKG